MSEIKQTNKSPKTRNNVYLIMLIQINYKKFPQNLKITTLPVPISLLFN